MLKGGTYPFESGGLLRRESCSSSTSSLLPWRGGHHGLRAGVQLPKRETTVPRGVKPRGRLRRLVAGGRMGHRRFVVGSEGRLSEHHLKDNG